MQAGVEERLPPPGVGVQSRGQWEEAHEGGYVSLQGEMTCEGMVMGGSCEGYLQVGHEERKNCR